MTGNATTEFDQYVMSWRIACRSILGQPEACADDLVKKWVGFVQSSPEWFFHETPMYYFVALVAPQEVLSTLTQREADRFRALLQHAIEQGDAFLDTKPDYDWKAARERVKEVFRNHGLAWPCG
jgi:hypothetical protein